MKSESKQLWIISITDLLMILVCFIVLIYSDLLIKSKEDEKEAPNQKIYELHEPSNLFLIYSKIINTYGNKKFLNISKDHKKIEIIINDKNLKDITDLIGKISHLFYKNKKQLTLYVKSDLADMIIKNPDHIDEQNLITKLMVLDKIRNILDKNSNVSNINSSIKIDDQYLSNIDREYVLITEIFAQKIK